MSPKSVPIYIFKVWSCDTSSFSFSFHRKSVAKLTNNLPHTSLLLQGFIWHVTCNSYGIICCLHIQALKIPCLVAISLLQCRKRAKNGTQKSMWNLIPPPLCNKAVIWMMAILIWCLGAVSVHPRKFPLVFHTNHCLIQCAPLSIWSHQWLITIHDILSIIYLINYVIKSYDLSVITFILC